MIGFRNLGMVIALLAPALAMAAAPPVPSANVRAACTPDAKRLCGAVIRDPAARHKCMVAHRAQLSEACKAALAEDRKAPGATDAPTGAASHPRRPLHPKYPPELRRPAPTLPTRSSVPRQSEEASQFLFGQVTGWP